VGEAATTGRAVGEAAATGNAVEETAVAGKAVGETAASVAAAAVAGENVGEVVAAAVASAGKPGVTPCLKGRGGQTAVFAAAEAPSSPAHHSSLRQAQVLRVAAERRRGRGGARIRSGQD